MEGLLLVMRGNFFLGSSSLKDFFLVCCVVEDLHKRGDWFIVLILGVVYCWQGCFLICRDGLSASAFGSCCWVVFDRLLSFP